MTQAELLTVKFARMLVKFEKLLRQLPPEDALLLLGMLDRKLLGNSGTSAGNRAELAPNVSRNRSNNENNNNNALRTDALEVLNFLNEKTNRSFRAIDTNLNLIISRLKTGAKVADCKAVIARKVRDWSTDPVMNKFLRPETLFAPKKFESYLGERERDA